MRILSKLYAPTVMASLALLVGTGFLQSNGEPLASGPPAPSAPARAVPAASSSLTWAPATSATIHPGVQLVTQGAQCTANFIYSDGTNVFIGMAAHCAGTGGNTATNGCTSPSNPLGTPVQIEGATQPGTLVYSSWLTMQGGHEGDPNTCQYNDLALVQINPADIAGVNPSVPDFGGPSGVDTSGTTSGEQVYAYGNSELLLGLPAHSMEGFSQGDTGGGWSTSVETLAPGVPGDSGSGFLDANGNALGVLSTLDAGVPGGVYNGVGNLNLELAYMHGHSSFATVQLVDGTVAFAVSQPPILG